MVSVFVKENSDELKNQLSDGRIASRLKVGEWFRIDRDVIDKSKKEIHRKCNEAGSEGKYLWKRFKESNKIAKKNPDQFHRLIETYIFRPNIVYKTEKELQDICKTVGDGICCDVICDLELQMRICNGELVDDLLKKADKLPMVRLIKFRSGEFGFFGGGADYDDKNPPASLCKSSGTVDLNDKWGNSCIPLPFKDYCRVMLYIFRQRSL